MFKKLSSKFTIGASFIFFAIALAIVVTINYVVNDMERTIISGLRGKALFSTGYTARNIDNWLIEKRAGVDAMYQMLPALPDNAARFAAIDSFMGVLGTPYIGFSNNQFHIPTGWVPGPEWSPMVRPWWIAAMENSGRTAFIPPFVDSSTGEIIIALSRHLGVIEGHDAVLSVDLFIADVMDLVWDAAAVPGSYAFLVDQSGRIITHTHNNSLSPSIVGNNISATYVRDVPYYRQFIDARAGGEEILRVYDAGETPWYITSHEVYSGWTLYVAYPEDFFYTHTTGRMFRVTLVAFSVCVVLLVLIKISIGRIVSRPVNRLKEAAQQIAVGNLNVNFTALSSDEIGELGRYFAQVADTVKSMIDDQAKFEHEYNVQGDVEYRIDASKYQNAFKKMMEGSNRLVDTTVEDILGFLKTLEEVNNGNFNPEIKKLPGKKVMMEQAIQSTITNMVAINTEISGMIESAAVKGDLSFTIDESKYKGDWKKLMHGLNQIAQAVDRPIVEIRDAMNKMAQGKISEAKIVGNYAGDFLAIRDAVNLMISTINSYLTEVSEILAEISKGNLTRTIDREYTGDFVLLKDPINQISANLNRTIQEISAASDYVLAGAKRITANASELAEGSSSQAASLEELNTAVEVVKMQTVQFSNNARDANAISGKSTANAKDGREAVVQMLDAMTRIKESSNNISKIIKTIQDIAFQTNLLSLNAAVEAARAGEHGKGFSVVAEEVRNLSARSQAAASETTALIQDSITRVGDGTAIANTTSDSLNLIVENATEVFTLINNIATDAVEQSDTIAKISGVLLETANMVQDNSKFAQESAATAEELNSQSEALQNLVAFFKL